MDGWMDGRMDGMEWNGCMQACMDGDEIGLGWVGLDGMGARPIHDARVCSLMCVRALARACVCLGVLRART